MEVSGSHGGAKQQQRVFVVVGSCRESLEAIGSHWESLGAVGVNYVSLPNLAYLLLLALSMRLLLFDVRRAGGCAGPIIRDGCHHGRKALEVVRAVNAEGEEDLGVVLCRSQKNG